jgi:hypothetical protein
MGRGQTRIERIYTDFFNLSEQIRLISVYLRSISLRISKKRTVRSNKESAR